MAFKRRRGARRHPLAVVSIPLSGLVPFKHEVFLRLRGRVAEFQSPCRDWWPSSKEQFEQAAPILVSIPLSGLVAFKHCAAWHAGEGTEKVSIPLSGLVAFKPSWVTRWNRATSSFNPPVGIGGLQAIVGSKLAANARLVSIPLSGLVAFKPCARAHHSLSRRCFNPPVGIGGLQASAPHSATTDDSGFQSPCRDWWPSSELGRVERSELRRFQSPCRDWWPSSNFDTTGKDTRKKRFNPPVGIGGLQACSLCSAIENQQACFNPPVGIGGLQAGMHVGPMSGRTVSIPLSGLVAFKQAGGDLAPQGLGKVSIPLSGLVAFKRVCLQRYGCTRRVSIPLSGLVAFKRALRSSSGSPSEMFQSPCRDWWPSSCDHQRRRARRLQVSIPLSGLVAFKLSSLIRQSETAAGFNPPVGIGGLQAAPSAWWQSARPGFQSPCRDWWPSSRSLASGDSVPRHSRSPPNQAYVAPLGLTWACRLGWRLPPCFSARAPASTRTHDSLLSAHHPRWPAHTHDM